MNEVDYQLVIRQLARQWQLTEAQYQSLRALPADAVPALLQVDTTLNQLFAGSPLLAELWMTSHNRAFANSTPMELIDREGMGGVRRIVAFLCLEL